MAGKKSSDHDLVEDDNPYETTYPNMDKPIRTKKQDRLNEEEANKEMDRVRSTL